MTLLGNEPNWFQYWVYILAAHYSWSGDTTMPGDLPWQAREQFLDTWFPQRPLLGQKPGYYIDLTKLANRSSVDGEGSGFLGYGSALDLSSLDLEETQFRGTTFHLQSNEVGDSLLMLAGRLNPAGDFPQTVKMNLESPQPTSELHFLMAGALSAPERANVGEIKVQYTSGRSQKLELVYGSNLFALSQDRQGVNARIAWTGETETGDSLRLWKLSWELDHQHDQLESLVLSSRGSNAAPIFLAVTGVN